MRKGALYPKLLVFFTYEWRHQVCTGMGGRKEWQKSQNSATQSLPLSSHVTMRSLRHDCGRRLEVKSTAGVVWLPHKGECLFRTLAMCKERENVRLERWHAEERSKRSFRTLACERKVASTTLCELVLKVYGLTSLSLRTRKRERFQKSQKFRVPYELILTRYQAAKFRLL